ncbi:MAG: circadian clock protein KaiC [Polyangia bacterium]
MKRTPSKPSSARPAPRTAPAAIAKAPTGIAGLDEITSGGLPRGRPTLLCGSAGCGKTLLSMEFLVRGATQFGEPGVFIAFEESAEDLKANVASLGFDLDALIEQKLLLVDYVHIDPAEIAEAGAYDLEGLFIRLGLAIDSISARRVAIDTMEVLFSSLKDEAILRSELRRLFSWLKSRELTAIVTAERGSSSLTRHGLEEYVSDCVLLLDHRVTDQLSTRRMRVVKYRGSRHGTNEYPFLIGDGGFSVLPVTSMTLNHQITTERVSSGVPRLDNMLSGQGFYRGSSVLISGTAGSGKSSLAALFANSFCERGERVLYLAFEESPQQIVRNMRSIGLDLQKWVDQGLLRIHASRPSTYGLEMHLAVIHKQVAEYKPSAVVMDPLTNLSEVGSLLEVKAALNRLIDFFKAELITALFLSLTSGESAEATTDVGVSSLMDVWILLRNLEANGERNRGLYVLKARGTAHSNQIREFRITERGVDLIDVYLGSEGVLMGSSRLAQEARERTAALAAQQEHERRQRERLRKRKALEAQIELLRAEYDAELVEDERLLVQSQATEETKQRLRVDMAKMRSGDAAADAAASNLAARVPSRSRERVSR